jgi:hypothetical protein
MIKYEMLNSVYIYIIFILLKVYLKICLWQTNILVNHFKTGIPDLIENIFPFPFPFPILIFYFIFSFIVQ